jgi:hypothetical protein
VMGVEGEPAEVGIDYGELEVRGLTDQLDECVDAASQDAARLALFVRDQKVDARLVAEVLSQECEGCRRASPMA